MIQTLRAVFSRVLPYLLMLGCGVIWGMTFSLARIATFEAAHPLSLTFWVVLLGGLLLLVFCLLRGGSLRLNRADLKHCVVISLFGSTIPSSLYFYAAPKVPAGVLAITVAFMPILTHAGSWLLGVDPFSRWRTLGVALGFCAIALLVLPQSSLPEPHMARWVLVALLAALCYAVENIYVDVCIPRRADLSALLTVALLLAALMLAPLVFATGIFRPISLPLDSSELAILSMAVVSCSVYAMFLHLVKMSGAVFASMAGYLMTLAGVFWGMLFFSERHSWWVWAALVVMLLGMLLVTPRREPTDDRGGAPTSTS